MFKDAGPLGLISRLIKWLIVLGDWTCSGISGFFWCQWRIYLQKEKKTQRRRQLTFFLYLHLLSLKEFDLFQQEETLNEQKTFLSKGNIISDFRHRRFRNNYQNKREMKIPVQEYADCIWKVTHIEGYALKLKHKLRKNWLDEADHSDRNRFLWYEKFPRIPFNLKIAFTE